MFSKGPNQLELATRKLQLFGLKSKKLPIYYVHKYIIARLLEAHLDFLNLFLIAS